MMISYVYGESIIVILGVSSDNATRMEIPTGVFSINVADGTPTVIYSGYVEDVRKSAKIIKTSTDGQHIYLFEELISTAADGMTVHIDLETGTVKKELFRIPKGSPISIAFMQPLYERI